MSIRFKFVSSYRNEHDYEIWGESPVRRITLTREWGHPSSREYDLRSYNGTEAEYRLQVDAKINTVSTHYGVELTAELYDAFCAFLRASHAESDRQIREMYDRWETPEAERDYPAAHPMPTPIHWNQALGGWSPCRWFVSDASWIIGRYEHEPLSA